MTNYVQYDVERNVVCGDPRPSFAPTAIPTAFPGPRRSSIAIRATPPSPTSPSQAKLQNPDGKSLAVALADLDGDGWTDIFIANDTQRNFVYFNRKDGTFEDASYTSGAGFSEDGKAEAGMSAAAADADEDGDIDLYASHLDAELNRFYRNDASALFHRCHHHLGPRSPTNSQNSSFGADFLDADNDGNRDLMVVNGHILDNIAIYHGGGDPCRGQEALCEHGRGPVRGRDNGAAGQLPRAAGRPRLGRG